MTALVLLVPLASVALDDSSPSGADVLAWCEGHASSMPSAHDCRTFFQAQLESASGRFVAGRYGACLPPEFGVDQAIALYRSEARRFPHVLHVPAQDLIRGMLLKFFACTGT